MKRVDRMTVGSSPKQGITRSNLFYHGELGIAMRFPAGWRIQNRPQNVVATSPGGETFVDLRSAGAATGNPGDLLKKRLQAGSDAKVTDTTINGLPAAILDITISGRPTRVACVFHDKRAYLIGAQSRTTTEFDKVKAEIDESIMSFRELAETERVLAHPLRLRVITARDGTTFAELARTSPLGRFAEGHLRVLNGLYPSGEPAPGQPLKIVE